MKNKQQGIVQISIIFYLITLKFKVRIQQNYFTSQSMSKGQLHFQIKGSEYPFGIENILQQGDQKTLIKKRFYFRCEKQKSNILQKLEIVKNLDHKNTINIRSADLHNQFVDLFYQYVPISLDESFNQNPNQTIKQIHRQFIQLAIHLAKNCILTSFSGSRCGIVLKEEKTFIKYYLPLNEITITNDRRNLERSVQLFNVQSMQYLDMLNQEHLSNSQANSSFYEGSSQRTFKNRTKLGFNNPKKRKQSQPIGVLVPKARKFSSNPNKEKDQERKLSLLCKQFSQISSHHKQKKIVQKQKFKKCSLKSFYSVNTTNSCLTENTSKKLKRYKSMGECLDSIEIVSIIQRSKKAINHFNYIKKYIRSYKNLQSILQQIKKND